MPLPGRSAYGVKCSPSRTAESQLRGHEGCSTSEIARSTIDPATAEMNHRFDRDVVRAARPMFGLQHKTHPKTGESTAHAISGANCTKAIAESMEALSSDARCAYPRRETSSVKQPAEIPEKTSRAVTTSR